MSECADFSWEREKSGTMSGCYRLYSWINHTVLMLILQILWKLNQISDYFKEKTLSGTQSDTAMTFAPLSIEYKNRRHIRSMSDVQFSTPYRLAYRSRKGSTMTLSYDSDSRARRILLYNPQRLIDSSDSSDYHETKPRGLQRKILKPSDSMRVL